MLRKWVDHLCRNNKSYAFLSLIIIILFSLVSRIPLIDGQLTGLNIENTKYYQSGKKISAFFDIQEFIEVKITPENTGTATVFEGLQLIDEKLTNSFEDIDIVSIHDVSRLFDNEIDSDKSIFSTLKKASNTPIVQDLISKDAESFLIVVKLKSIDNFDLLKFNGIVNKSYSGIADIKCMSSLHVEQQIATSLQKDVVIISIIIIVLFTLFIIYLYRNITALLYTIIIILISVVPTFFLFTILDIQINLITALSIPIILILSLADAIHLLTGFYNSQERNNDKHINSVMKSYIVPSFLTSLTTTIAFSSFLLNSAENIQYFGLIVSFSVLPSFFLTYMISPFLLKKMSPKRKPKSKLKILLEFLKKHRKPTSYILIALALFSITIVNKLSFDTDFESFIPKNSEIYNNSKELSKEFNSQLSMSVLVEKDSLSSSKKNKEIEKDILSIVDAFELIESIGSIKSVKDQIKFKKRFGPIASIIRLPRKNNPYRSEDKHTYRIEVRLTNINDLHDVNNKIESILNNYSSDYNYTIFSKALLVDEVNQSVAKSLFLSLLFSFIFIFLCFFALTKSLVITLISLIANIIPLSFIVLIFYYTKLDLNILTAITTVVCLGIIVDDTIHVIYRKQVLKKDDDELGLGIITTSIILVLGFLTFLFSSFEPCQVFGYVSSMVFLITMISDLTILPFLLDLVNNLSSSPLRNTNERH